MKKVIYGCVALLFSPLLFAATESEAVTAMQTDWAHIKYEVDAQQREAEFKTLVANAEAYQTEHPKSAPVLIWRGIILSTYAGEKGGLGALSLVKEAKALFEQSIEIDPAALQGSAYTSLGSLYYQVPGWPIGFGSDKKARSFLQKALELNPDGLDSNFFYGDFLIEQHEAEAARKVLEHALQAPPRAGREVADRGRKAEIEALLKKL